MVANADTVATRQGDCMMPRPIPSMDDSKRADDLLMKDLASADVARIESAARRFLRIEPFRSQGLDAVIQGAGAIQRKHALRIIAREQGYWEWKNLKDAADVFWLPVRGGGYSHKWCKSYEEARAWLEQRGGHLLTAQGKWFVAERGYIEFLGLDPEDPHWAAIGWDAAQPRDAHAHGALVACLIRCRGL